MLIYIKLILTSLFWAGTFIAGSILGRENGVVSPFSAAFLRFAVAAGPLVFLTWRKEKRLRPLRYSDIVVVLLLALTGVFLYHFLFLKGLQKVQPSRASVIIATSPVFITFFSAVFFKEKLTMLKFAGIALSVFGAVFVITEGKLSMIFNKGFGKGEMCIVGCLICWVIYSLLGKAYIEKLSGLVIVCYSVVLGMIMLFIPAAFGGLFSEISTYTLTKDWTSILYLGIFGTVVGYVWYYDGLKQVGPVRTAQFINLIPIFTVLLSSLILKERITISLLAGTVLVLSGVYLTNKRPNYKRA
jgi:drug/metabolite transporter (DMT)-like permease